LQTAKLEFFFDCTSPWTFLAFAGIQDIARRHAVDLQWRPILVGGVFNAVNPGLYEQRARAFSDDRYKRYIKYTMKDLADWAALRDISIVWPDFHPASAVKCMRACIVAQKNGDMEKWAEAVFNAYWSRSLDVSQEAVLRQLAGDTGFDADTLLSDIEQPFIKTALRENTEELIARGGYGSPTLFINDTDMYFGNDRLQLVEYKLQQLGLQLD
jgi:2-hydroxychromene-2-carboxylate isomerase